MQSESEEEVKKEKGKKETKDRDLRQWNWRGWKSSDPVPALISDDDEPEKGCKSEGEKYMDEEDLVKGTKKLKPYSKEFAKFLAEKENAEFLRVSFSK